MVTTSWHDEAAQSEERVTEKVAARVGDLVHISLQQTLDLVRGDHALGRTNSGNLIWYRQQAAERPAGVVLSRAPWTIKVVAQERG